MLTRRRVRRVTADEGFTLIELIVSIAILGVVMVALTSVMFNALVVNKQTRQRLDATRSEQFAAVYFANDVQGAKATAGVLTSGTAQCGTSPLLLELRGDTYDAAAVMTARKTVVTYVLETTTVDGVAARRLVRLACEAVASATTPLTPVSSTIVAAALANVTPATPTVSGGQVSVTLTRLDGTPFTLVGKRRTT
jgi:prepilin-type N-terminal cleavage/methylation domain-containing protein